MENKPKSEKRIFFLDELRGFAVLCMVFYHAFYILDTMFGYEWANKLFYFFYPVQPFFASLFIFICGVSCALSRSNLKRGLKIAAASGIVTLFTAVIMPAFGFIECEIYFGILHLLAVCILVFALSEKGIRKINPFAGLLICAVLYPFFGGISQGELSYGELISIELPESLYSHEWLAVFGLDIPTFFSADYFPIFPSLFVFLAGAFSGIYFSQKGFPEWMQKKRIPFFAKIGKFTLIIYIAHMPLIYGLAYGIEFIIKLFH